MCVTSLTWKQDKEGSLFSHDTSNATYPHSRSCKRPYRASLPFCEHQDLLVIAIVCGFFPVWGRLQKLVTNTTPHPTWPWHFNSLTEHKSGLSYILLAELESCRSTKVISMNSSSQLLSIFRNMNSTCEQGRKSFFKAFEPWTDGVILSSQEMLVTLPSTQAKMMYKARRTPLFCQVHLLCSGFL